MRKLGTRVEITDWGATEEHPTAAVDAATAADIVGIQGNVAGAGTGRVLLPRGGGIGSDPHPGVQVELKMMLSQIVRGTASTSRMRAVDGEGEARGGPHTPVGAGTGRARAPTGVRMYLNSQRRVRFVRK